MEDDLSDLVCACVVKLVNASDLKFDGLSALEGSNPSAGTI